MWSATHSNGDGRPSSTLRSRQNWFWMRRKVLCDARSTTPFLSWHRLPARISWCISRLTLDGRAEFYSIARAARSGGVLFDIGAHSGVVSALFSAANPQNQVFSFEPSPILSERLLQIRELNRFGERMCIEPNWDRRCHQDD
jgi:hypothetical protein